MVYPAFVELLGQLALSAFANVPPILKNPRTDVSAIEACKRLIKPVPKELWFYGTIGRLFRRRGYFVGPNGSCIPAKQGAGPADERYPYKDRDAAAGKAPPRGVDPRRGRERGRDHEQPRARAQVRPRRRRVLGRVRPKARAGGALARGEARARED